MTSSGRLRPDIHTLIRTLRGEKASYVPIVELGVHPLIKEKFLGKRLRTLQEDVAFWHDAGYDYIKLQPRVEFAPSVDKSDRTTQSLDGRFHREWAASSQGAITNLEEFRAFQFPDKMHVDYSDFERIKALLPDGMGVIGQYGDIFTMTWDLMGFETFALALYDDPELVQAVTNKVGAFVFSMFEYFAQSDEVDILWYSDDIAYTTGLMVSTEILGRYFFPWLNKIGNLARACDKPLIYHSDGRLYDVFDEIIACGVDAIHPIEPKAMAIGEVKQKVGRSLALIGNIDVDLLTRGTPQEVRRQVIRNIEEVGMDGGYCVGSGNSIPEYVKFENYLTMIETAKEAGSF